MEEDLEEGEDDMSSKSPENNVESQDEESKSEDIVRYADALKLPAQMLNHDTPELQTMLVEF